jgi:hypothetical protein
LHGVSLAGTHEYLCPPPSHDPPQASLTAPIDETGCQAHLRWYTQLAHLENRFGKLYDPATASKYAVSGLQWESTFDGSFVPAASLQGERVGVLFNLAATWAECGRRVMATAGSAPTDADLKQAVRGVPLPPFV